MLTRSMLLWVTAVLLTAGVLGCVTRSVSRPEGQGYGLITVRTTTDLIHWGAKYHVYYWDAKGKRTRIWDSLYHQLVQDQDIALFQGHYQTRLFAVHAAGPVADITDDVALRFAEATGTNLLVAGKELSVGDIKKHDHAFDVQLGRIMGRHGTVTLSRDDILKLVQEAKDHGERMEAPPFGGPYYRREVSSTQVK
jgi:hypothetical protein